MIGRLRGPLLETGEEDILIEAGGVGYIVRCGVRTIAAMPETGEDIILHIESQTREDGTRLYGFLHKDERKAFQTLLAIQGVGPKAAHAVLDVLTPAQLAHAVANEDKTAISRASGVGPKLAVRILTELKGKVIQTAEFAPLAAKGAAPLKPSVSGEAVAALLGLGVNDTQARLAVEAALKTLGPEAELSVLIRTALKSLGK